MKKSKLIFLSIISIFILSGCGTPKIDKTLENMKNLNSYTMKVENKQNNTVSNSIIEFDGNNNILKQTSNINLNGTSKETITYTQLNDNKLTTYTKGIIGDNWIINEVEGKFNDNKEITKITSLDTSKFTKVKSSSKNIFKYEVDSNKKESIADIKCYVYTDGKYITKIEISSESTNLNEVITFSNMNNTNVTIPNDVKENAKKLNEVDLSNIDIPQLDNYEIPNIDTSAIKEQIDAAKEYMNSEEFKNQIEQAQEQVKDYMNSEEFQNQIEQARQRANSMFGN